MMATPGGSWRYLVAKTNESLSIFGSINVSRGKRLLFFPSNYNVSGTVKNRHEFVDHISLEWKTKLHSHYTFRSGDRLANGRIKKIDNKLSLWFILLVSDFKEYIPLPNQIKLSIDWPSSDISRFSKEGVLANYRTKSIIKVPSIITGPLMNQIDFIIGSKETEIEEIPDFLFEHVGSLKQPNVRESGITKIDVSEEYSLFVKITERAGQLDSDSLIISTDLA